MYKFKLALPIDSKDNINYILFFSFFSAWLLAFPFLGQVLYGLFGKLRVKALGKVLILSNVIMLLINTVSINISPILGLFLCILALVLSLVFLQKAKKTLLGIRRFKFKIQKNTARPKSFFIYL